MADTFKFQKDWYEAILNDKYVKTTPQEMAYIVYAAMQYAFNDGQPIDLGETFGEQFRGLNRSMPNIYDQINRIRNYEKSKNEEKYDNDAIYQLRMEGKTGKEICQILGYPLERERSLSSTKGWKKAREDKKSNTEICKVSVKSVGDNTEIQIQNTDSVQNDTEILQKNTDSVQSVNTEICKNVQKSVELTEFNF